MPAHTPSVGTPRRRPAYAAALLFVALVSQAGCFLDRASAAEGDRIAELLRLAPGMQVADVGAGDGDWIEVLVDGVRGDGHVYATEVTDEELDELRDRVREEGWKNVTVVRGDQQETGLADGCCDAILLRMVYHHFQDPAAMRASLRRAVRPGGLVAVIDIRPQEHWRQLEGVPERGGHGIPPESLVEEMALDGFEALSRHERWNDDEDRYCVLFRAPAGSPADTASR